ncbi:MAG: cytidine deaminase [Bacteroidales bacterium]|nr:cytidine deaminase [Bacteroidales bacterium]
MKKFQTKATIIVYENESELSAEDQRLLALSREAATRAYAAYSHFQVGAALLLENGEIVTGNNQENSAYPSGLCAERTAAFYASSRFPGVAFKKLFISAINPKAVLARPIPPCGACRQSLLEYEQRNGQPIIVLMAGQQGEIWQAPSIESLVPLSFSDDFLPATE